MTATDPAPEQEPDADRHVRALLPPSLVLERHDAVAVLRLARPTKLPKTPKASLANIC